MPSRNARFAAALVAWLFLIAGMALTAAATSPDRERPLGTGSLEALAPDGRPLGPCPLEHTEVDVEIAGFVSRVVVTQVFHNPFEAPVEAIYTFPLSQRGAVDAMWLRTGERTIRGEIKRREEARQIYEAARDAGQTAALLDQERPNIFTQSLANLMPGESVEIEIHYVETLDYSGGAFEFSFPTVVGPRFIPGQPIGAMGRGTAPDTTRVPDASRITPPITPEGTRAGHDIDIRVRIDAGVPIRDIRSRLHQVKVVRSGERRAEVRLAKRAEIPNRDFVLQFDVAAEEVQSGVLVHRDGRGDGFATFVILPPERVTPRSAAPKELVFVIDRSGSQSGLPLQKAKETMLWILENLNPNDTFQVVDFGSTSNHLFDSPQLARPHTVKQARRYIQALQANGGTMMAEAIRRVASQPTDHHRLRIVTFMTDGYVGNDFEVVNLVREVRGTSRWFPFGTGNGVNRYLIDAMAREGGGEAEYVLLDQPGDEVAERFYQRIRNPVLTDVSLEFRGLDVSDVFPQQLSDVWDDRPLIFHARYGAAGRGQVVVRGYRAGRPYREEIDVTLPARAPAHDALGSMWARAKVEELQSRDLAGLQNGQFPSGLQERIVRIALEHRILTQFTSFVAVEDRIVNEGGQQRTVTVPVEMPQGVSYEGVFGAESDAGIAGGLGRMQQGHASKLVPMSPPPMRALGYVVAESEPQAANDAVAPRAREERRDLSDAAQSRLAPELLALLAQPEARHAELALADGRVKVLLKRAGSASPSREELEAAGLEVLQLSDGSVLGWIAVGDLEALAALRGVEEIEAG